MDITLSDQFKKYHLGCGDVIIKDYLNIGFWQQLEQDTLYANPNGVEGSFLYNYDLVKGIPAKDESLDVIYHSHFLEHLSYIEGINFTRDCFRTLKSGGLMRIVVPDLELWIQNYSTNNKFFLDEYRKVLHPYNEIYNTKGAIFMGMLHNHGHKMGYDFETLKFVLEMNGFAKITRKLLQQSDLPDIETVEPYRPVKAMESLCVECYKP